MELGACQMEFPHPFHINLLRPVHHDFGDGVILQERFNGAVAQDFIAYIRYQPGPFASGHHKRIVLQHPLHVAGNHILNVLAAAVRAVQDFLLFRSHFLYNGTVHIELQGLVFLFLRIHRPSGEYILFLDFGLPLLFTAPQKILCHLGNPDLP
ncbi:unknown [Dialister sp. CAG:357]|nr:unknown [Dialister sp. CAG:357]